MIKSPLIETHIDLCFHSPFNSRKTRDKIDIEHLAKRIDSYGFEETRAVWARPIDGKYEVFAGGNRFEAMRLLKRETILVIPHLDCSDDEVAFLTEFDNENDEYHIPVSAVDIWAEYARLKSLDWTQQRIAKAKGVSQQWVSDRLRFHSLNDKVKAFTSKGLLPEVLLQEICHLQVTCTLSPWLTTSQAWEELAEKAVNDRAKNGSKSREAVKKDVQIWQEFITYAEQVYNGLPDEQTLYDLSSEPPQSYSYKPREEFLKFLAEGHVRSLPKVKVAEKSVRDFIAKELSKYSKYVESQSVQATQEAERLEKEAELRKRFQHGDARTLIQYVEGSISLVLTDPPYGQNYQSNRRWATSPPQKIVGDTPEKALSLLSSVLSGLISKLALNAHVLVFTSWRHEPDVRQLISQLGLEIKGSLVWVKEEHTSGDVQGSFAPSHERIIHAVKGTPTVSPRVRDVFEENRTRETSHPAEKPLKLLEKLIKSTTEEGELVVDPFAGCASTLMAAYRNKRQFWGCEIVEGYWEEGQRRLIELAKNV